MPYLRRLLCVALYGSCIVQNKRNLFIWLLTNRRGSVILVLDQKGGESMIYSRAEVRRKRIGGSMSVKQVVSIYNNYRLLNTFDQRLFSALGMLYIGGNTNMGAYEFYMPEFGTRSNGRGGETKPQATLILAQYNESFFEALAKELGAVEVTQGFVNKIRTHIKHLQDSGYLLSAHSRGLVINPDFLYDGSRSDLNYARRLFLALQADRMFFAEYARIMFGYKAEHDVWTIGYKSDGGQYRKYEVCAHDVTLADDTLAVLVSDSNQAAPVTYENEESEILEDCEEEGNGQ